MFKSALSMLLFSCLLGHLDCADNKQLAVKRGENATLQCYGTRGAAVVLLRWRKPDQQPEGQGTNKEKFYVFYFKDNVSNENFQLPSFKGRVQLRDPQMKDGDLSVIIKNISMNDAGIYECCVGYGREEPQLMSSINLTVEESGPTGGQSGAGGEKSGPVGLIVGLSVLAVLVGVVVGFLIYRKCKKQTNSNYQRPADQDIELPRMP